MKNIIILILVVLLAGGGIYFYFNGRTKEAPPAATQTPTVNRELTTLAPEVEAVLEKEIQILAKVGENAVIVAEVRASNEKNRNLTAADIKRLDDEWQASKSITPFIREFLSNKTALALLDFQKTNPRFKEIFIADAYGLNVGQTDKTSDYYQADEAWWKDGFNQGGGKTLHGPIEFDQSSQTEAISIYIPIMDKTTSRAIGVMKGVIDLSAIRSEL